METKGKPDNKKLGNTPWTWVSLGLALIVIVLLLKPSMVLSMPHSMEQHREMFMSEKKVIHESLLPEGGYQCCLKQPCMYCIEKDPKHGEGATCSCLADIVDGKHPCGECIGEILEGHGNPYLANYFAVAIAEEVGEEHLSTLKKIIEQKYGMPVAEQN